MILLNFHQELMNTIICLMKVGSTDVVKVFNTISKNPLHLKKISSAGFLLGKFRFGKGLEYLLIDSRME